MFNGTSPRAVTLSRWVIFPLGPWKEISPTGYLADIFSLKSVSILAHLQNLVRNMTGTEQEPYKVLAAKKLVRFKNQVQINGCRDFVAGAGTDGCKRWLDCLSIKQLLL